MKCSRLIPRGMFVVTLKDPLQISKMRLLWDFPLLQGDATASSSTCLKRLACLTGIEPATFHLSKFCISHSTTDNTSIAVKQLSKMINTHTLCLPPFKQTSSWLTFSPEYQHQRHRIQWSLFCRNKNTKMLICKQPRRRQRKSSHGVFLWVSVHATTSHSRIARCFYHSVLHGICFHSHIFFTRTKGAKREFATHECNSWSNDWVRLSSASCLSHSLFLFFSVFSFCIGSSAFLFFFFADIELIYSVA